MTSAPSSPSRSSDAPAIGAFLPTMTEPGERPGDVGAAARHAEDLGLESVWVVDQLVAGTGAPFVDSVVALAAAAATTERIRLGFGVAILPLRPTVWLAKQVASLQVVSNGRILLGIGAGGDRHDRSWAAAGVERRRRGRMTDDAIATLPELIAGTPSALPDVAGNPTVTLAPGATPPPVLVGGMSEAAMARAATLGADWFVMPLPPAAIAGARDRMAEVAAAHGRAAPGITAGMLAAVDGDPALGDDDEIARRLTNPDGVFGMPGEAVAEMLVRGGPEAVAERLAALGGAGVDRVVLSSAAGNWHRQVELLAEARALLG